MSDNVKFIFITLIKVPCVIFVSFFIFNIFAFFFIYFKMLGFSYVVMQEVVENNYITATQRDQINLQFGEIDAIPLADNTNIIIGLSTQLDGSGNNIPACYDKNTGNTVLATDITQNATLIGNSATTRTQYGTQKTVGVHCDYTIVWPLSHNNSMTATGRGGTGVNGNTGSIYNSVIANYNGDIYEDNMSVASGDVTDRGHKVSIPLNIYYTVPGLKYYADK